MALQVINCIMHGITKLQYSRQKLFFNKTRTCDFTVSLYFSTIFLVERIKMFRIDLLTSFARIINPYKQNYK